MWLLARLLMSPPPPVFSADTAATPAALCLHFRVLAKFSIRCWVDQGGHLRLEVCTSEFNQNCISSATFYLLLLLRLCPGPAAGELSRSTASRPYRQALGHLSMPAVPGLANPDPHGPAKPASCQVGVGLGSMSCRGAEGGSVGGPFQQLGLGVP